MNSIRSVFLLLCGFSFVVTVTTAAMATVVTDEVPDMVERVSAAVVNVQSTQLLKNSAPLDKFLGGLGEVEAKLNPLALKQSSLGSGFVVAQGAQPGEVFILTNFHVIENATSIEVILKGNPGSYKATVVGSDSVSDIAVLKAQLDPQIKALELAPSSKLRVGETVIAIGNPFGLGFTVTRGILSAKDRSLGVGRIDRYLQTDASINFGNSGGPLFNLKGEVIGMNTLVRADAQGIGFAIPSDTILKVIPGLQKGQKIQRGWLGIVAQRAGTALRAHYGLAASAQAVPQGAIVLAVVPASPAAVVGLKEGDLILSYGKEDTLEPLLSHIELRDFVESLENGDSMVLKISRGTKQFLAKVKLGSVASETKAGFVNDAY